MTSLLDLEPVTAAEIAAAENAVQDLLGTRADVLLVQAEAILTLEAVARSIAAPDGVAVNVVTGPYGAMFGGWMRSGGARVIDVVTPLDEVVTVEAVEAALDAAGSVAVLALVHAEAATGGSNPVHEVVGLARERGVVTVVDAVASVGAELVLPPQRGGGDVIVLGGQKALAGPAGVSAAVVSDAAWALIDANPAAPRGSFLSLTDIRDSWSRAGRNSVVGTPNSLETRALGQALERVRTEGLGSVIERHARSRAATLAGAAALGIRPFQRDVIRAAAVDTTLVVPYESAALGGIVTRGNGPLSGRLVRVNHTGRSARLDPVLDALDRLAHASGGDPRKAFDAAGAAFHDG